MATRREFVFGIGAGALATALPAEAAQQPLGQPPPQFGQPRPFGQPEIVWAVPSPMPLRRIVKIPETGVDPAGRPTDQLQELNRNGAEGYLLKHVTSDLATGKPVNFIFELLPWIPDTSPDPILPGGNPIPGGVKIPKSKRQVCDYYVATHTMIAVDDPANPAPPGADKFAIGMNRFDAAGWGLTAYTENAKGELVYYFFARLSK